MTAVFALKLRIPAWTKGATLRVSGKTESVAAGELATVGNRWRAGDTVDLIVPLSASAEAYRTVIAGRNLVFVPYFTIDTAKYSTYFRIA